MNHIKYDFEVVVKWSQTVEDKNKTQAIEQLKETFKDEYNLDLDDSEIKLIR